MNQSWLLSLSNYAQVKCKIIQDKWFCGASCPWKCLFLNYRHTDMDIPIAISISYTHCGSVQKDKTTHNTKLFNICCCGSSAKLINLLPSSLKSINKIEQNYCPQKGEWTPKKVTKSHISYVWKKSCDLTVMWHKTGALIHRQTGNVHKKGKKKFHKKSKKMSYQPCLEKKPCEHHNLFSVSSCCLMTSDLSGFSQ